jgi:hypothetical protein
MKLMRRRLSVVVCATAVVVIFAGYVSAQEEEESGLILGSQFPKNFGVAKSSVSPDGRYGVLAPADWENYEEDGKPQNRLVEMKTGTVLSTIQAETGLVHMNHGGILPARWSPDGAYLLWTVDGKWTPRAIVLLKIENGQVKWQRDLLGLNQKEILARTRKAAPGKYAAGKKANQGNGGHYPDGFTINVSVNGEDDKPLQLPLSIHVQLESDPKAIEDFPKKANITSEMLSTIGADGKLTVTEFHLGIRDPH